MAEFSIGMNYYQFYYGNEKELKQLPKEQRQKIANFWQDDLDGQISNEIEYALLKGFTSKSGKVSFPNDDPTKFKNRYKMPNGEYADVFERSNSSICFTKQKDNSIKSVKIDVSAVNDDHSLFCKNQDLLIDTDGDGIPDERVLFLSFTQRLRRYVDSDLDGHFEEIRDAGHTGVEESAHNIKNINKKLMSDDE